MSDTGFDNLNFKEIFMNAGSKDKLVLIICSWFGTGLAPRMPGTVGSLAALPLILVLTCLGELYLIIALIVLIPLSIWAAGAGASLLRGHDPSQIVIDEVAGLLLTFFFIPFSVHAFLLGFILFRIFDILKPFPAGWIDKNVKHGFGIVLDDLVAGIYANICVRLTLLLT